MVDRRDPTASPPPRQAAGDRSTVGRVFSILDAFRGEMVLGIRAIARQTGLPAPTVHRIVTQLVDLDVLSRAGNRYRLGTRIFEIGTLHYPPKLRAALHPFLADLQRVTGADVSTVELSDRFVVVVDHVPARKNPSAVVKVGARIPAHATAGGKAILAQSQLIPFHSDSELTALTSRTIVRISQLRTELARVRAAGVAFEHGEADPETKAVAAPLLNRHGKVLGALMVSSTAPGFSPEDTAVAVSTLARTLTRVGANTDISFYAQLLPHPGEKSIS